MKLLLMLTASIFCSCSPIVGKYVDPGFFRHTSRMDTAKITLYIVSDSIIPTGNAYEHEFSVLPKEPIRTEELLKVFGDSLSKYRFANAIQISKKSPNLMTINYDFKDQPFGVSYMVDPDSSYSFSVNLIGIGYNPTDTLGKNWVYKSEGNFVSLDYTYILNRGNNILKAGRTRSKLERFCFIACENIDSLYNRLILKAPKDIRNIAFSKEPLAAEKTYLNKNSNH